MSWETVIGAASYSILVSTVSTFASTVSSQTILTASTTLVSGLSNNMPYYWEVNANNAGGTSTWSNIWEFITNSSEIKSVISGILYTSSGIPSTNTKVSFYHVNYNPYIGIPAAGIDSTITDNYGHYSVLLDTGYYNILAAGNTGMAFIDSVRALPRDTTRVVDTLYSPGSLQGSIKLQGTGNPETVFIIFMGTGSVWVPSDTLGDFATGNMARGSYQVQLITTTPNYNILDTSLTIMAGKIDTLPKPILMQ